MGQAHTKTKKTVNYSADRNLNAALNGADSAVRSFLKKSGNYLPSHDFDDLIQEIRLKICEKIGTYDASLSKPNTWASMISRSTYIDFMKKRHKRSVNYCEIDEKVSLSAGKLYDVARQPDPVNALISKENTDYLGGKINTLNEGNRYLAELLQDYDKPEVNRRAAIKFGCSQNAINQKKLRLRRTLAPMVPRSLREKYHIAA
jgi:RNA polymerase sigma factor (sigma-70 family)